MTNYASERYLRRAIESVLGQSHTDLTLYIFDNHSPGEAPAIIQEYASKDTRVVVPEIPKGLAGIPLMDFAWRYLNKTKQDYTITLGGHDFWNTADFLKTLVDRMDGEIAARAPSHTVAICYTDVMQVNMEDEVCGRYQDIMQIGQIGRPFIPLAVIMAVNSPQFFGLWNEQVRRKIPIRYDCGGFDHLIVMEAALHGMILFDGRVQLVMRAPPPGDNSEAYGKRHFSPENLARGQGDMIDQIEWCLHCVKTACSDMPAEAAATYRMMLTASITLAYLTLRGTNLMQVPSAFQEFVTNPLVVEIQKGAHHCLRFAEQLIKTSKPRTYETIK
jgi:hypothetical protein